MTYETFLELCQKVFIGWEVTEEGAHLPGFFRVIMELRSRDKMFSVIWCEEDRAFEVASLRSGPVPKNIHRVLGNLFTDDLNHEFRKREYNDNNLAVRSVGSGSSENGRPRDGGNVPTV